MAIVFVSPRKKQITFFTLIAGFFVLAIIIIALIVFFSKPVVVSEDQVFKKPNISINFSVLDSDELKKLALLDPIQHNYIYSAVTEAGKSVEGKISAVSEDDAKTKLTEMKLSSIVLQKDPIGRKEPFDVYYQQQNIKTK